VCRTEEERLFGFLMRTRWNSERNRAEDRTVIARNSNVIGRFVAPIIAKGSKFCDPQSPWQRGTNENTNGLLWQYFPKRTDLSGYSQLELDQVALRLNQRPRKTLGFETPATRLRASVAPTH
jgi:hypothetical protein